MLSNLTCTKIHDPFIGPFNVVSTLTPRKKCNYMHIHSFMICFPNMNKFAVKVTEYQERTHTRTKINCASHS